MTCVELWAQKDTGFTNATPSMMQAMLDHYHACPACRDAMNARVKEREQNCSEKEKAVLRMMAVLLEVFLKRRKGTDPEL